MKLQHYILTLVLLLATLPSVAQNKKIEQQKAVVAALERSIAAEEKELAELKKSKASTEKQVASLARQIEKRNAIIRETTQQIKFLTSEVEASEQRLQELGGQLTQLEENMREIVRAAYRNYRYQDQLTYLLSADSFSEMTRRVALLRAATEHRKAQIDHLLAVRQEVQQERDNLTKRREELSTTKTRLDSQRKKLKENVASAKKSISKMTSEQKRVLESKLELQAELNNAKKELKRLQELARGNKAGSSFSSKTKALNLPVVGGKVKRYKGNMAEIIGKEGAAVTSIYEGKVLDIKQNKVTNYYEVYIAHGKYITSYANLSAVSVAKNSIVKRGQRIGTIGTAINLTTMETENKIVFGIYSPTTDEVVSAANCFKK